MKNTWVKKWNLGRALGLPASTGISQAMQWLMLARLGVLYALLAVVVLAQVFRAGSLGGSSLGIAYGLLALSFGFNLLQALFVEKISDRWLVPTLHVVFDAVVTSIWLGLCAEKESLFALLYLIQILVVSLVLYQKGALLAAICTTLGFGFVMAVHPIPNGFLIWGVYATLFTVLGVVGGYLSEELRRTTESLKDKSRKIEKLMALHERIIADIPTGLLTVDRGMRINFINPAAAQILGCQANAVVGKDLRQVAPGLMPFFEQIEADTVPDEDAEAPPEPKGLETALSATGDEHHRSFFVRAKSDKGQARLQQRVEIGVGPHRRFLRGDVAELDADAGLSNLLDDQATGGRVLLFQDVTKLLHLEEKSKQNEKLAAVGQLAAGIAHEIRNPLASMSASIEMLKGSLPPEADDSENHKLMDIAIREIDRLNRLITEFLGFVKPDKFRVDRVELSKLLSEIVGVVRQSKELNRLKETRGGGGTAPSAELREKIAILEDYRGGGFAEGNAEKLKQVVWNLLVNAIQAMTSPGKIEVGCAVVNAQRVKFWIQDEGQGMTEDALAHLYEPFFTTKEKGTGLGLATAYKIIEAHHGEIRVHSELRKGTRFEVVLQSA